MPEDGSAVRLDPRVAHEAADRVQELGRVAIGLQPHDVRGEQPFADRPAHRLRQDLPDARRRPRNMGEVEDRRVRTALADAFRGEVEVVVLEQEHRSFGARRRLHRGVREQPVRGLVTRAPGVHDAPVDVGLVRQGVHLVLQEPEQRIGDDLVVALVDVGRQRLVMQPKILAGDGFLQEVPDT